MPEYPPSSAGRMNGLPSLLAASPEGPLARRGERVRPPARKSLWLGGVRGNLSYHHPHFNPPPSSPEPNMVQGKGEESFLEN